MGHNLEDVDSEVGRGPACMRMLDLLLGKASNWYRMPVIQKPWSQQDANLLVY